MKLRISDIRFHVLKEYLFFVSTRNQLSFLNPICKCKSIYSILKGDLQRLVCQHNSRHFISLQIFTSYNTFFPFKKIFLPDTLVVVNDSLNFCVFGLKQKKMIMVTKKSRIYMQRLNVVKTIIDCLFQVQISFYFSYSICPI